MSGTHTVNARDHVLVVEDDPSGHHLVYVRLLLAAAVEAGARTTLLASTRVATSEEHAIHLAGVLDRVDQRVDDTAWTPTRLGEIATAVGATITVVPDGDLFAIRLGLRRRWSGPGRLAVLLMRDPSLRPTVGHGAARRRVKEVMVRRARQTTAVSLVLLTSPLRPAMPGTVPDPVEIARDPVVSDRMRDELGLRPDTFWFGVLGAISLRKNVGLVADSLRGVHAHTTAPIGLLVAGPFDPGVHDEVDAALGRLRDAGVHVVVVDRLLANAELDAALGLVDCVVAAHSNEGPSGIVGKSVMSGTRIACAGAEALRRDVEVLESALWSPLDRAALTSMLIRCLDLPAPAPRADLGAADFAAVLVGRALPPS
ncbi:MAG: hypothetical protein JWM34_1187 [Ilumatobacteraceae bacterium]|nr:hypothetical protein [Ilumatobacteraceae bacterium]